MIKNLPFFPIKIELSQEQQALEHVLYPENSQIVVNMNIRVGENAQNLFGILHYKR